MARGGMQDLPHAGTLPSAKASRHGARAKGFAPRRNAPHGEGLPTRRTSERICPTQERSPRRRPPDTAHGRKDLPRAGTLPSAKASRHGARAKGFARAGTRPTAKASRHGARAKGFAPRGSPSPHVPTNGGPPSTDGQPEKHPFGGVAPETVRPLPSSFTLKKRLLHEIQLFYGESHIGSRQIFPSFPSVGRCVARERNPVPPVAPHRGSEHRGLRRTGEMVRRFDAMCPRGDKSLPHGGNAWPLGGGRCGPGLRCFGERFHRRRCANPDACRGRRCARGHDDLGQRAFRYFRPTFCTPLCDKGKTCGGQRCSRGQVDLGQRAFRCSRPTFRNPLCDKGKTCGGRRCSRAHDNLGQRAFRYSRPGIRNRRRSGEKTCGGRRCSRG